MISVGDHKWMNTPATVAPQPVVHLCGDCRHFEHDAINPSAGMGCCRGARAGEFIYPGLDIHCSGWKNA